MNKIKIATISHALVIPVFRNRWRKLAKDKKYDVHLFIPNYWEQTWFGEKVVYKSDSTREENFYIHALEPTNVNNWGRYFLKGLYRKLKEISPDLIYIIHEESIRIHHQVYLCNWLNFNRSKIIFFSMNALGVPYKRAKNPIKKFIHWSLFQNIKLNTKAALVHYPGCLKSLRDGGYRKPIYIQTQVGVDEDLFSLNLKKRKEYREKLNLCDKTVIGYVGRIVKDKGIDNLLNVFIRLRKKYDNLALLLVGNGSFREELEVRINEEKLTNRVKITGFVDQGDVPNYMNAMDIFFLGSKTTPKWIDTFPLVTVQAQAVGLPVIASNSGAIPWQLDDSALIFKENDEKDLEEKLKLYIENEEVRNIYARRGRERTLKYFCHQGMNENFKKIVDQVLTGNFIYHKKDEPYFQWKAY